MLTVRSTDKKLDEGNVMNANGSARNLEKGMHPTQFCGYDTFFEVQHDGEQRDVLMYLVETYEKRVLREQYQ